jgi:O-antigen/teichoic acid export membrane protein
MPFKGTPLRVYFPHLSFVTSSILVRKGLLRIAKLVTLGKRKRAALAQAGLSYLFQAVGLIQGIVLIPFYIKFLGVELYGYWLATGGILFALSLFELGLAQPINQKIALYYGRSQPEEVSRYFWTGNAIYAFLTPLFIVVFLILAHFLPPLLSVPERYVDAITLAFIIASASILLKFFNDFFRGFSAALLQPFFPQLFLVIGQAFGIVVIVFALFEGGGVLAIPVGLLATQFFIFVCCILFFIQRFRPEFSLFCWAPTRNHIKEILFLAPYVMFSRFSMRLTQQLEPTIITLFVGAEFTTLYAVNAKISEALERLVSVIWGSVFSPFVNFSADKTVHEVDRMARSILLVLLGSVTVLMAIYVMVIGPFMKWWLSPDMVAPLALIMLIALARTFDILGNFMSELHVAMGRIRYSAKYLLAFSGFRFLLLLFLVMNFGVFGAPLSAVLSGGLLSLFFMFGARRHCQLLRYKAREIFVGLGAVTLTFMASWGMVRVGSLLENDLSRIGLSAFLGMVLMTIFLAILRWHLRPKRK